ncbi:MAG: methylmalonyl Co-A mutase-associated GTPase MeaB [Bacteroidia bacterium]|nr:methylmalonyl Co-A mutase-associated GTPase MeaB [Bacteroidia bacterium]
MSNTTINTPDYYITGILAGDISILSRAITLVESTKEEHQLIAEKVIDGVIEKTGKSFRLGITGVPGVGKSTFIESFGLELADSGHKVAILAIDPSSQKSKGSILGDKTRMEKLSVHPKVYIRPSPSSGTLGGVAQKTFETILLCEAAGYDFIIVETVGVGQSEITISQMTDFFLLLMLAGAGDELQGIKRGIMEMADSVIITKADGANVQKAKSARSEYAHALHLFPPTESGWIPKADTCSALQNDGITNVIRIIEEYKLLTTSNGYFAKKRNSQLKEWLHQSIADKLKEKFYNNPAIKAELSKMEDQLLNGNKNPYKLASDLISKWKS